MVHEIDQQANGDLTVRVPGTVRKAFNKPVQQEFKSGNDEVIAAKPLPLALADTIITRARNASTIPVNDSVFALYNGGTNQPVIPVATDRPIALGTRSGNSCLPANGVF